MVSAPPARSDDNPLEEAFAIGVGLNPGIIGEREVDLAPRGRGQRPERHRCAPPKSFVGGGLGALLEFVSTPLLEAVTVEVDRSVVGEAPVEHAVAEVLEGIEAAAAGRGQEPEVAALELLHAKSHLRIGILSVLTSVGLHQQSLPQPMYAQLNTWCYVGAHRQVS